MDLTSIVISVALAAAMLFLLVRLPLGNLRAGFRFRQGLAQTLDQLRLSRMLGHLGIDRTQYLHEQSSLSVRKHMTRCDGCTDKQQCDEVLASDAPADAASLGFCANIDDLTQISQR